MWFGKKKVYSILPQLKWDFGQCSTKFFFYTSSIFESLQAKLIQSS